MGLKKKERWNNKRAVGGGVVWRIKKEKDRNQKKKKKKKWYEWLDSDKSEKWGPLIWFFYNFITITHIS